MKTLKLQRISYRQDCTLGVLYDAEGDLLYATLELPDMGNLQGKSCIPEGSYICKPYSSDKFKDVYEITNVPNRTKILIHSGNTTSDIEGCILIGRNFGKLKGKTAVLQSKVALEGLRKYIGKNDFTLLIERI
jgi:hypothetical protein